MLRPALLLGLLACTTLASPLLPRHEWEALPTFETDSGLSRNAAEYRLPGTTIPTEYTVKLRVDPNLTNFTGEAKIRFRAVTNTSTIVLHSNRLIYVSHVLKQTDGVVIASNFTLTNSSDARHFLTVTLAGANATLTPNQLYDLEFVYSAPYGNLVGLYKSSYVINGTTRYLGTTQFQPTHAREVFPCYDEPALKAVFNIHIYSPPSFNVIANMDVIAATGPVVPGFNETAFRSTPLMSTYLIAFVISDFDYKSNTRDGPIIYPREFRIYARPNAKNLTDYALDVGQQSFQYLQAYTDVSYRLPKVDHVAIPDFAAGAMENWGLVTYREEYLLYTKGVTNSLFQMYIATIMSHENAHFWFGNEVSPHWWDNTWLNEGFATFFEYYATDKVYNGEWRLMDQFTANDMQNVMIEDSLPGSNSMTATVGSPTEISRNFNGIAYAKAGSVIRMMQHAFGEDTFRLGISNYLKSLPTGVTEPKLLFDALQGVVVGTNLLPNGTTVNDVFGSWSSQAGYPIIHATRDGSNGTNITLTQERFYQNNSLTSTSRWWIPLNMVVPSNVSSKDTRVQTWMSTSALNVRIEASDSWFILNRQQMGYYRVMYNRGNWDKLTETLRFNDAASIHPLNKAQLIDDAAVFSRTNRLTYNVTFELLAYLDREIDWIPWVSANRVLNFLNVRMPASSRYETYRAFVMFLTRRAFDNVGLNQNYNDSYVQKRMRTLISRISCEFGYPECVSRAFLYLNNVIVGTNQTSIEPDVQPIVYCYGLRQSDTNLYWNGLFNKYVDSMYESEKSIILNALGCSINDTVIDSYLEMTISNNSRLRSDDRETAIRSVINAGSFGIERVLNFLDVNFLRLSSILNQGLPRIITSLGNVLVVPKHIEAFNNITEAYKENMTANVANSVNTANRAIAINQEWIDENMGEIDSWLLVNGPVSSATYLGCSLFLITLMCSLLLV